MNLASVSTEQQRRNSQRNLSPLSGIRTPNSTALKPCSGGFSGDKATPKLLGSDLTSPTNWQQISSSKSPLSSLTPHYGTGMGGGGGLTPVSSGKPDSLTPVSHNSSFSLQRSASSSFQLDGSSLAAISVSLVGFWSTAELNPWIGSKNLIPLEAECFLTLLSNYSPVVALGMTFFRKLAIFGPAFVTGNKTRGRRVSSRKSPALLSPTQQEARERLRSPSTNKGSFTLTSSSEQQPTTTSGGGLAGETRPREGTCCSVTKAAGWGYLPKKSCSSSKSNNRSDLTLERGGEYHHHRHHSIKCLEQIIPSTLSGGHLDAGKVAIMEFMHQTLRQLKQTQYLGSDIASPFNRRINSWLVAGMEGKLSPEFYTLLHKEVIPLVNGALCDYASSSAQYTSSSILSTASIIQASPALWRRYCADAPISHFQGLLLNSTSSSRTVTTTTDGQRPMSLTAPSLSTSGDPTASSRQEELCCDVVLVGSWEYDFIVEGLVSRCKRGGLAEKMALREIDRIFHEAVERGLLRFSRPKDLSSLLSVVKTRASA